MDAFNYFPTFEGISSLVFLMGECLDLASFPPVAENNNNNRHEWETGHQLGGHGKLLNNLTVQVQVSYNTRDT